MKFKRQTSLARKLLLAAATTVALLPVGAQAAPVCVWFSVTAPVIGTKGDSVCQPTSLPNSTSNGGCGGAGPISHCEGYTIPTP